jgi:hypothetical protein
MKKLIFAHCFLLFFFVNALRVFAIDVYDMAAPDDSGAVMNEFKTEDEEARAYNVTRTVKTVEGLNFTVEPDRPIQKIAGVYRPIDLDSYIALKFNKLEKKMDAIYSAMQARIDVLTQKLADLTKQVDKLSSANNTTAQN